MGDNQKAIELLQRSLEIGERVLGPDHAALASPLTYLARVRASEGKPADALPALERALRLREKAFGRNNRDVAETLVDIAEVQVRCGGPLRRNRCCGRRLRSNAECWSPRTAIWFTR